MTSDKIYPGMLIRNCHGDIGWVVGESTDYDLFGEKFPYWVEWNYGSVFMTSAQNILEDHQRLLDFQRQHGL